MKYIFLLFSLLVVNNCYSQSNIPMSKKDSLNSSLFKNSANLSRIQYFNKIKHLIILAKSEDKIDQINQNYTTKSMLYALLGMPNFNQTDMIFGYYLLSFNEPCIIEFESNNLNQIKKYTIKDCK